LNNRLDNQSGIVLLFLLLAGFIFMLATGCQTVPQAYSLADQATYEAIAPEYAGYVKRDESLTLSQKEVRLHTLRTWFERIDALEDSNANL
jgi:hypothetical protein